VLDDLQGPHDEENIEFVRTTDGLHHIHVYRPGGPAEHCEVEYAHAGTEGDGSTSSTWPTPSAAALTTV
jgi:hypothetical protein